ncbi:hypothetical protein [Ramlibacter humi]|uniref:Uncharacterized protein n=1 Tax=Ramlibacter humi TaxID=2530451 RepID=A0A4Z0BPX1_9BURK|nr:hypothetical protein [Ramlibacter humi]TFZ00288.1 hypothetical protein EZ216_14405 [Ramlibacter humi]
MNSISCVDECVSIVRTVVVAATASLLGVALHAEPGPEAKPEGVDRVTRSDMDIQSLVESSNAPGNGTEVLRDDGGRIRVVLRPGQIAEFFYGLPGAEYNLSVAGAPSAALSEVREIAVTTRWRRDCEGRVVRHKQVLDGVATQSLELRRDVTGRVDAVRYPSGGVLFYAGAPGESVEWNGARVVQRGRGCARVAATAAQVVADAVATVQDAAGRAARIEKKVGEVLLARKIGFNFLHRRVFETDWMRPPAPWKGTGRENLSYDLAFQLPDWAPSMVLRERRGWAYFHDVQGHLLGRYPVGVPGAAVEILWSGASSSARPVALAAEDATYPLSVDEDGVVCAFDGAGNVELDRGKLSDAQLLQDLRFTLEALAYSQRFELVTGNDVD